MRSDHHWTVSTVAGTLQSSTDRILAIPALTRQQVLIHGFSTLGVGSMHREDLAASPVTAARAELTRDLGLDPGRLTVAGAVHGAAVARVDTPSAAVPGCDALVTDRRRLPLLATFADCYPVVLLDRQRPALALVHAGWRGTAAGVAGGAVEALRREYGSKPAELTAGLGPGICGRCYEVSEEVAGHFPADCVARRDGGRFLLDLSVALERQLVNAGVPPDQIHVLGVCTRESPSLASHRRSPDGTRCACLVALR